jgi:magnesium chelatase family protein
MITRYQKRISGPMLDRIDIHIEVPRVDYEKLSDDRLGEPSANVQARVEAARQIQRELFSARATHASPQLITPDAKIQGNFTPAYRWRVAI